MYERGRARIEVRRRGGGELRRQKMSRKRRWKGGTGRETEKMRDTVCITICTIWSAVKSLVENITTKTTSLTNLTK